MSAPALTCTCATLGDKDHVDDGCACWLCTQLAKFADGCPHRLEQVVAGKGLGDRLYDGMCDECFELARDVRDCGLRVAEHEAVVR